MLISQLSEVVVFLSLFCLCFVFVVVFGSCRRLFRAVNVDGGCGISVVLCDKE